MLVLLLQLLLATVRLVLSDFLFVWSFKVNLQRPCTRSNTKASGRAAKQSGRGRYFQMNMVLGWITCWYLPLTRSLYPRNHDVARMQWRGNNSVLFTLLFFQWRNTRKFWSDYSIKQYLHRHFAVSPSHLHTWNTSITVSISSEGLEDNRSEPANECEFENSQIFQLQLQIHRNPKLLLVQSRGAQHWQSWSCFRLEDKATVVM